MTQDFGDWAAAFLRLYREEAERKPEGTPGATGNPEPVKYGGVTPSASRLLESIDAGGVPAFMTANLLRIARDNGLEITAECTPNEIVEALRLMATREPTQRVTGESP